uniref:bromodomain-containing protein DDB_G0280777-like isoform X1 n=1 Tax=Anopheles coluzzii TaxID=1518534 RepID=UPI0020FFB86A|nr:bromodomain-containing protein DDB_G0280777-like isoform X1 [Anopheles coluzzii]
MMKHRYGFAIVGLCLLLERTNCALQKGAIEQKKTANYLVKENSVARVSQVEINTNYDPKKATTALARRPTVQQPKILINGQPIQNLQSLVQQIKPTAAQSSKRVQQVLVIQQPQRVVQQTVASAPKTQIIKLQKIVQQVQPSRTSAPRTQIIIQQPQRVQQVQRTGTNAKSTQIIIQQPQRVQQVLRTGTNAQRTQIYLQQAQPVQQVLRTGTNAQRTQIYLQQPQRVQQIQRVGSNTPRTQIIIQQPQRVQQVQRVGANPQQTRVYIQQPQRVQQVQRIGYLTSAPQTQVIRLSQQVQPASTAKVQQAFVIRQQPQVIRQPQQRIVTAQYAPAQSQNKRVLVQYRQG